MNSPKSSWKLNRPWKCFLYVDAYRHLLRLCFMLYDSPCLFLEAFAECRTPLLDSFLAIFSAMEFSNFSVMNQSSQVSGWILLINFGDQRTRNAGDIGANLKFVECSKFYRFLKM